MILRNIGSSAPTCLSAAALLLFLLMFACPTIAEETEAAEGAETAAVEESGAEDSDHENRYGNWDGGESIINTGSPGMFIPLDGGSIKKFEKSLSEANEEMTDEEITTVQNALEYLLIYDLSARRDKKQLYKNLDGKTAADILSMVKWRLEGRPTEGRFSG